MLLKVSQFDRFWTRKFHRKLKSFPGNNLRFLGTLVMPIDTVRRILMNENLKTERNTIYSVEPSELIEETKYRGFWHCTKVLVKEHGITRLWRGEPLES